MKNLKKIHKILIGLLLLAVLYLGYAYIQFRNDLFAVYDIPAKHTYSPSETTDLILVDFNKYGCTHCQTLHPILLEAIRLDGNVTYAPRAVTFGDEWNGTITAAVYAAGEQGKFIDLFNAVYDNWPVSDIAQLYQIAGEAGIDTEQLSRDISKPEIAQWMQNNDDFFLAWGLSTTPVLLVGKNQMLQYGEKPPTVAELLEKFSEARASWL